VIENYSPIPLSIYGPFTRTLTSNRVDWVNRR
jgi:hypothetical protein